MFLSTGAEWAPPCGGRTLHKPTGRVEGRAMKARLLVGEKPRMVVCPLCGAALAESPYRSIYRKILEHCQRVHGKMQVHPCTGRPIR